MALVQDGTLSYHYIGKTTVSSLNYYMAGYTWVAKHQSTGWVSTYKSDYPWTPAQMGPACRSMPYSPPHVNSRPLATPYVRISNTVRALLYPTLD